MPVTNRRHYHHIMKHTHAAVLRGSLRFPFFAFALVALISLGLSASAQKTRVTHFDAPTFMAQMLDYLNAATSDKDKQKANAALVERFAKAYVGMSAQRQDQILSSANGLLQQKMRPLPDAYNYVEQLTRFATMQGQTDNFGRWLEAVLFLQSKGRKTKDLNDFVAFTDGFLTNRTLGASRAATWQAQPTAPFTLRLEGQQILIDFATPMELYYASDKDNGTIYGTTGRYYYFDSRWVGQGGRINWDRTGIPTTACWAQLSRYEAITKFAKFAADSVMFTNSNYFTTPIMGRVEEQLSAKMEPDKYTYPKFRSYQKDFRLKDILPGVDYSGSFMMNGGKFITSDTKNPATIIFYRDGNRFATLTSTKFTITHDRIVSEQASVRLYVGDDSIYNNGILARYLVGSKQLVLVNDSKRNYYSPYTNSYHQLDMYCESMVWRMDADVLDFSMLGQSGDQSFSTFESNSYYSERKFRELQGIEDVNPVERVYAYIKSLGMAYEFYVDEFAQFLHLDIMQAKSMVHTLARSGLVAYNEANSRVYVKDKLIDYHEAFTKSPDANYDAIVLESASTKGNARLDLSSGNLQMAGVKRFVVSDSQQVAIYPRGGNLVVKKNRDIDFSGRIDAGRFVLFVSGASFRYSAFRLDLPQVDSMMFYVTQFNNPQEDHIVYTPLYNLKGYLQIDDSSNHSGLRKTKDYPIFNSIENSFVYYDRKDIHGGTYRRDKFYYTLHPFEIRNMVDFATDSLMFGGVLTSGGIFPDITEPLRVQRDYSLGFTTKTPKQGYDCYGGKGHFTNLIDLSYQGLRGAGKLEYLTSQMASKSILFTPDSASGFTDTLLVREQGGFPDVYNGRAVVRWFPYADSMRVQQLRNGRPFTMYRGDALLAGNVVLRPQGALGEGAVTIGEGTVESDRFDLHSRQMDAQVSAFTLRSDVYNNVAFYATNMRSHVDYDKRRAEFTANADMQRTLLPLLSYAAYVDKFGWEIDRKELDLLNSKSEGSGGMEGLTVRERVERKKMPGARFVSTDPKRDSLTFRSTRASYRYNAGQLSCRGVFLVRTADAVVAPAADTVHVRAGGSMDLLKHAQLLASADNRYHLIYDADVLVDGARKYSAKGNIDYVDEDDKKQRIYLSEVAPDAKGRTVGRGFISDSVGFTLNSAFGFAGSVRVEADSQYYYFEGGVRLLHKCAPTEKLGLLAYASYLNPRQIRVVVPEIPTDWRGNRITASILLDRTKALQPTPAFLTNDRAADNELMTAHGLLTYDSKEGRYMIASAAKLENPDEVVSPYLALDTRSCSVEGEGPINFQVKQNHVRLFSYGTAEVSSKEPEATELKTVLGFTFPIDEKVLGAMTNLLTEDLRLAPSSPDNDVVRRAMMHYLGPDAGATAYTTYVSTGFYEKIPRDFESTLLLEGINWKYSPVLGYYYNGVAGLAAVGKKQVHLAVRVKAQFYHRGNGLYLVLYLQAATDHWYYFCYEFNSQQMTIQSSAGEWVDMIKALPPDARQVSGKGAFGDYRYRIGTSRTEVPNFLMRIDNLKQDPNMADDEEEEDEE